MCAIITCLKKRIADSFCDKIREGERQGFGENQALGWRTEGNTGREMAVPDGKENGLSTLQAERRVGQGTAGLPEPAGNDAVPGKCRQSGKVGRRGGRVGNRL